jgi:hypothetical protein
MYVTGKDEKPKGPAKSSAADTAPIVSTSKWAVGDEVVHPQFGDGTITDIEGAKLTINFADGRTKQILDYYVKRRRH